MNIPAQAGIQEKPAASGCPLQPQADPSFGGFAGMTVERSPSSIAMYETEPYFAFSLNRI
jgi:hypothetical protein